MSDGVLSLSIDVAEPRIQTDRLGVLVTGTRNDVLQWDMSLSTSVYIDPVTSTGMLIPVPLTLAWASNATTADPTSGYYRIGKASTNQASNANWVEHVPDNVAGNVYLYGLGVNDVVSTLASFERNRGWYFSLFMFSQGDTFLQLAITWGNVVCNVYSDGTVQVLKNGLVAGSGSLGKVDTEKGPDRKPSGGSTGAPQAAQSNVPVSFVIIPCRTRELLFLCNRGGAFHVVFDDISKDETNPTILPAGNCSWQVPQGQAMVSFAPLHFLTSGYLISYAQEMRTAPVVSAVATPTAYYDNPNTGAVVSCTPTVKAVDGVTAFVGDGTTTQLRMRVDLTSDGTTSPWVYGASAVFAAVTANTNGTQAQVLDAYTIECDLTVPEAPAGVQMVVTCKNAPAVDGLVAGSKKIGNRPVTATIGTIAILTGRSKSPRWQDASIDEAQRLIWEMRDFWKAYEVYQILDPIPWDKRGLQGVIQELAMLPGFPLTMMDVEAFDFTLPSQGQSGSGNWAVIPEAGDTSAKWLEQLWQDYCQTAIMGWYPSATGPKFRCRTPDTMPTTPAATIYLTRQQALDYYSEQDHWRHIVEDGFVQDTLEPEANTIRVTGWDSRLDKAFQVHDQDSLSLDPTILPSLREDSWTGEPYPVALFDPAITDLATASYVAGVLRKRLFGVRKLADIPCQMQFKADGSPVWRGDILRVEGYGNYRVRTLRMQSLLESAKGIIRPSLYTGEWITA